MIELIDVLLFQAVDSVDIEFHNLPQAGIVKSVEAVIGDRFETAS
jgi:hypothetical protein